MCRVFNLDSDGDEIARSVDFSVGFQFELRRIKMCAAAGGGGGRGGEAKE